MSAIEIHGTCDDRFAKLRDSFAKNFEDGREIGASFALLIEGEPVVDLWGGSADLAKTRPWSEDTVVPVASSSKIILAIALMMLVDRKLIDLDARIASIWPEFGQAGKDNILVRHILSHSTGVAGFDRKTDDAFFENWEDVIKELEGQEPWWEPGTQMGYHNMTQGYLIGELIRRSTGRPYLEFLEQEILKPLGSSYMAKIRADDVERVAEVSFDPDVHPLPTNKEEEIGYKAREPLFGAIERWFKSPVWFSGKFPALDGHSNAKGLAEVGSILACGGTVHGHRYLSDTLVTLMSEEEIYTDDLVFHMPMRFSLGVGLGSKEYPLPFERAMHWGGFGGSIIFMIPEARACYAYTPNNFIGDEGIDPRGVGLSYETMDILLALK